MDEASAHYAAEFVSEQVAPVFSGKLGELSIIWRHGAEAQERDCCLLLPIEGAKAAVSLVNMLASHLGMHQLPFSGPGECLWLSRRLVPAGSFGISARRGAPWLLSLWSHPKLDLPDAESSLLSEFLAERFEVELRRQDWCDGEYAGDESLDAQSEPPDENFSDAQDYFRRIAEACDGHPDYYSLMLSAFRQDRGIDAPAGVIAAIHGISSLVRAQTLMRQVVRQVGSVNTIGLLRLDHRRMAQERGWQGHYVVFLAELIFGNVTRGA